MDTTDFLAMIVAPLVTAICMVVGQAVFDWVKGYARIADINQRFRAIETHIHRSSANIEHISQELDRLKRQVDGIVEVSPKFVDKMTEAMGSLGVLQRQLNQVVPEKRATDT